MKRISATEVARGLSELLNRVEYRNEEFEVERNGRVVARILPAEKKGTVRNLFDALDRFATDDEFADDLEAIQAEQPTISGGSAWDS